MSEYWIVYMYNELDAEFGYDIKPTPYKIALEPAVAKSIARHLEKTTPEFIHCWAEEEPRRYW